jgi:flagellin
MTMTVLGVQTNQAFYLANSNATKANNSYNQALDRLSSGLRINNAKDDAAGLAIAETMEKDIRGLGQANRNANDGISALQIAEGGATEILDMLNRMNELAIQAKSGTYTTDDRAKMNVEYGALATEIGRVATNTSFNGTDLLNSSTAITMQVGTASGDTLDVTFADMQISKLFETPADADALPDPIVYAAGVNGDITDVTNATTAMAKIEQAIGYVTSDIASLGASQTRLDSVISNNTVMKDATALAKGRIMDADFAVESAALAKSNVLLQVSQSMLAQANQQPSLVLGLIK